MTSGICSDDSHGSKRVGDWKNINDSSPQGYRRDQLGLLGFFWGGGGFLGGDHFDVKYKQPLGSKWLNVNPGFTTDNVHDLNHSQSPQASLPNPFNQTLSLLR